MKFFKTEMLALFVSISVMLLSLPASAFCTPDIGLCQPHPEPDEIEVADFSSKVQIEFSYSYRPQNGGPSRPMQNGDKLHSGDSYKIQFTPKEAGYVYIFQYDSHHQLFRLFPTTDFIGTDDYENNLNPVQAHLTYFVPGEGRSFVLDQQVGKETLHFFFFKKRNPEIEENYRAWLYFRKRDDRAQIERAPITAYIDKGIEAIRTDNGQQLVCEGSNCVSSITFQHLP
ncbi:MAG: hypothetical protein DRR19_17235 [Candidatus Parabeggiatoa sp. nov. 1]|nr:MAG: hypothetical protein DRR19_17235 [Gammaproteobacteria bacterium]